MYNQVNCTCQASLELTVGELEGVRDPLPDSQEPFYLVVETSGSNEGHDYAKLEVIKHMRPSPFTSCMYVASGL